METNEVFITNDVESAGSRLGVHSTLSIGACVISRDVLSFDEYRKRGLVFYAELKPGSLSCDLKAMRVGCSQLICLEELRQKDKRYDPAHPDFDPTLTLIHMMKVCEYPALAMKRFGTWISLLGGRKVTGVTDTVFFDGGRVDLNFGQYYKAPSPFGWSGLDLDSMYRGYTRRRDAKLKELGITDERINPHRADEDAIFLAMIGRKLFFELMGW